MHLIKRLKRSKATKSDGEKSATGVPRLDARELVGQEGDILHLTALDDAWRALDGQVDEAPDGEGRGR